MATLLATPCSAPVLGAVLAWALTQPGWMTALMLGLVGVGMSLPYLLLAIFPDALNKVPRAGRWSDLLKQGLGIVMIGVAVYLLTLIPNTSYWPWVLAAGVLVALVCWAWGQLPTYNMERSRIWTIRVISVAVGIGLGIGLYFIAQKFTRPIPPPADDGTWQTFNIALLDDALANGRPVVVDWTASWCINCHVLEATVLTTQSVQDAFRKSNALLLKADLSTDNPPATLLNRELGGEAIPVLAIFSPAKDRLNRPVVLRDSYFPDTVIKEVQKAAAQ
jgi:thiol:disulfide interchange protein DsbD